MRGDKRWWFAVLLLVLSRVAVYAQGGSASLQGSAAQGATSTIQARSNLVVVDVVVMDRSHNAIHNLKAGDFQVREGGVAQTIKSFEEHMPATNVAAEPLAALPPGVFTNYTPTPASGPVNVLLIDKLNTPLKDQPYLHDQIVKFLRTMKPGIQLAIFGLNTQLVYLQGFTSDPAVLLAALESRNGDVRQSALLNAPTGTNSDSTADALASLNNLAHDALLEVTIANARQYEAEQASDRSQQRTRRTLEAMNTLARSLAAVPGRKNLIWFSGSFPISIQPDATGDLRDPFAVVADMSDQFRETTALLSRSQVAVYPVDAHGVETSPMQDASTAASGRYTEQKKPDNYAKDNNAISLQIASDQGTMRQMARDTGGQAFVNTNGLSGAVTKAIDLGSTYYTLSYAPTNAKYDGSFRKIQVEVAHAGELSYRRGYYAQPPSGASGGKPLADSASAAMVRGAPGSTQILFKAFVAPAGTEPEAEATDGNVVSAGVKGPFRRYAVSYSVVPADITLRTIAEGRYEAHLEFVVFVYSAEGTLLNRFSQSLRAKVGVEDLKKLENGIQYRQVVSVPTKGETFLRIGVHDLNVDRIGVLEVAVNAVRNLAVAGPPGASPAVPQRSAPSLQR